jgi:hypothetical protein
MSTIQHIMHSKSLTSPPIIALQPTGDITSVEVTVSNTDESHPQVETDESYTLTIPAGAGAATITSKTVYGESNIQIVQ